MAYTFYSQRKSVKNGNPAIPVNKYGTQADMEYQFHLFCASAVKNEAGNDLEQIEWGTLENGIIERKVYRSTEEEGDDDMP